MRGQIRMGSVVALSLMGVLLAGAFLLVPTATASPSPGIVPTTIVYSVTSTVPVRLTPTFALVHVGLVQVQFISHDSSRHAYALLGTPVVINLMPGGAASATFVLSHPGAFSWINLVPGPGQPVGLKVATIQVA